MTAVRPLLERGVWKAAYLLDGCEVLHAIDRRGNCVRRVKLYPEIDERIARAWLSGFLERVDPTPRLRLVKPMLPAARMNSATFARLITVRR